MQPGIGHQFLGISLFCVLATSCAGQPTKGPTYPFALSEGGAVAVQWNALAAGSEAEASSIIDDKKAAVGRLLQENVDPYVGHDTTLALCQQRNLPAASVRRSAGELTQSLHFYSSLGLVIGACPGPGQLVKTHYQLLYCQKAGQVFVVRLFYPAAEEWRLAPQASCH